MSLTRILVLSLATSWVLAAIQIAPRLDGRERLNSFEESDALYFGYDTRNPQELCLEAGSQKGLNALAER